MAGVPIEKRYGKAVMNLVLSDLRYFKALPDSARPSSPAITEYIRRERNVKISTARVREYINGTAHIPDGRMPARNSKPAKFAAAMVKKRRAEKTPADSFRMKKTNEKGADTLIESWSGGFVRTVEDALRKGNVDTDIYEVKDFVLNSWEVGAKGPNKKICVTPLWQVKVWIGRKRGWSPVEFRKMLVEDIAKLAPRRPRVTRVANTHEPLLGVLGLFDAHFGKLSWEPESGENYDLKICRDRYLAAGRELLSRAKWEEVDRLLYIVGNDFFHTDQGKTGATNSGTPQDCDGRWQKAFRIGKDCCIELIDEASQFCPVDVIAVSGNHDTEKCFCLGELLDAYYRRDQNVNVQNDPSLTSYYRYGTNLLGFTHGTNLTSDKKRAQMPNTMADSRPRDWAETTCREWLIGHFHHEHETVWRYRTADSCRQVVLRILPSLSGTDAWHAEQNYKSVLAAELHLYHHDNGRFGYYVHQPPER